jgi:hypothetical protein
LETNSNFSDSSLPISVQIYSEIRKLSKLVASNVLELMDVQFTDIILILINEEMKRFEGIKWKQLFPKITNNRYLALPKLMNSDSLGIDYELPISQVENLRKIIQTFLMIRGIVLSCHVAFRDSKVPDDFFSSVYDPSFLVVDETLLIPENLQENKYFDMKGKKFLDSWISTTKDRTPASMESASQYGGNSNTSLLSTTASVLTLGLVNSNKRPSSKAPATPGSKSLKDKEAEKYKEKDSSSSKLLLVQDPDFLILVSKQIEYGKPMFKIFLILPLLYSDAKIDLQDKTKFKLVVRSWFTQPKMVKNESEIAFTQDPEILKPVQRPAKSESFLKPVQRSEFYSLTVQLETEQLCALAVQHIETRRKLLTKQKLESLKLILSQWTSEKATVAKFV